MKGKKISLVKFMIKKSGDKKSRVEKFLWTLVVEISKLVRFMVKKSGV